MIQPWHVVSCNRQQTTAMPMISGPRQAKKYLRTCAKCADSHHSVYAQSLIGHCSPLKHFIVSNDSRITKVMIRLRGCTGWSGPSVFAYVRKHVFERRGPFIRRTSMARICLGPRKLVPDMGSSSHWELIIAAGQEVNRDNLRMSLELPRWSVSNEYTQHIFSWYKRKFLYNILKYLFSWVIGRIS